MELILKKQGYKPKEAEQCKTANIEELFIIAQKEGYLEKQTAIPKRSLEEVIKDVENENVLPLHEQESETYERIKKIVKKGKEKLKEGQNGTNNKDTKENTEGNTTDNIQRTIN